MARTHNSLITTEDLYRLPDDNQKHELVRGRLVSEPLPGARHGRVAANIVFVLQSWARKTGEGIVYTCNTGFVLARNPDTVRGPDVAFVVGRRQRAPDESRYIEGAPDLAVAVLSPGNRRDDIQAKVANYLGAGATLVWIVDPQREIITIHTRDKTSVLGRGGSLAGGPLLLGFCVEVGEIF